MLVGGHESGVGEDTQRDEQVHKRVQDEEADEALELGEPGRHLPTA